MAGFTDDTHGGFVEVNKGVSGLEDRAASVFYSNDGTMWFRSRRGVWAMERRVVV